MVQHYNIPLDQGFSYRKVRAASCGVRPGGNRLAPSVPTALMPLTLHPRWLLGHNGFTNVGANKLQRVLDGEGRFLFDDCSSDTGLRGVCCDHGLHSERNAHYRYRVTPVVYNKNTRQFSLRSIMGFAPDV